MPTEPLTKVVCCCALTMVDHVDPGCLTISYFPVLYPSVVWVWGRNCLYLLPEFAQSFTPSGFLAMTEDSNVCAGGYVHTPMLVHTRGEAKIALKS